jgi:hypothetical protein
MAKNDKSATVLDDPKVQEQGFIGVAADPTPNENYTVAGVTSGKPTPETDAEAAEAAARHGRNLTADNSK